MDRELSQLQREAKKDPSHLENLTRLSITFERAAWTHNGRTLSQWFAAITDGPQKLRQLATRALCEIGPVAVPGLIHLLQRGKKRDRWTAAIILGDMGPLARASIPALHKALHEECRHVRRNSARALGRMGSFAKRTLPALLELCRDKNDRISEAAAKALIHIEPNRRALIPKLRAELQNERTIFSQVIFDLLRPVDPEGCFLGIRVSLQSIHDFSALKAMRALSYLQPLSKHQRQDLERDYNSYSTNQKERFLRYLGFNSLLIEALRNLVDAATRSEEHWVQHWAKTCAEMLP